MQEEGKENDSTAGVPEVPGVEDRGINMNEDERIIEPANSLPEVKLEDLPEQLQTACARAGWARLLPGQSRAIPYVLAKRNLMVQSQTGSASRGFRPADPRADRSRKARRPGPGLVPTRSWRQVSREAETLGAEMAIRICRRIGESPTDPSLRPQGGRQFATARRAHLDHLIRGPFPSGFRSCIREADRMSPWLFTPT